MNRFLVHMAVALGSAALGLSMVFYSLERLSLINLARTLQQGDGHTPLAVQISLFAGLALANLAVLFALLRWSRFVRSSPGIKQAPVWVLVLGIFVGGAGMLWALATHTAWLRVQEQVPLSVHWGYILFQVMCALVVLTSLVFVGARWSPGYKPTASDGLPL